jgi:hypothetical protein
MFLINVVVNKVICAKKKTFNLLWISQVTFKAHGPLVFFQPDSSQIVGRLMQIRDYIKQASSMMDSLRKSGDPVCL